MTHLAPAQGSSMTAAPSNAKLGNPFEDAFEKVRDWMFPQVTPAEQARRTARTYRALANMYLAQKNPALAMTYQNLARQWDARAAELEAAERVAGGHGTSSEPAPDTTDYVTYAESREFWSTPGTKRSHGVIYREGPTPNGGAYALEQPSPTHPGEVELVEYRSNHQIVYGQRVRR